MNMCDIQFISQRHKLFIHLATTDNEYGVSFANNGVTRTGQRLSIYRDASLFDKVGVTNGDILAFSIIRKVFALLILPDFLSQYSW